MSTTFAHSPTSVDTWRSHARATAIALLVLVELVLLDRNYGFPRAVAGTPSDTWVLFNESLKLIAYVGLFGAIALSLMALAQDRKLPALWLASSREHRWAPWLAMEALLFLGLLAALPIFQTPAASPPWIPFLLWLLAGVAMLACAALALAPLWFWHTFAKRSILDYAIAFSTGAIIYAALGLAQTQWNALASATLQFSYTLLQLYEPTVAIDTARRIIVVGDFDVRIDAACSGYEGIGLVLTMMSFFLFAFRQHLRFPHALMLLPIGAATIWVLNAVRIAVLLSLGAHVSPDVAINGFHAQAGWLMFLIVTVALMVVAYQSPFFRADARHLSKAKAKDPALILAAALLAPFAALMGARIIGALFGSQHYWPGVFAMAVPALVIWAYRDTIRAQLGKLTLEAVAVGVIVGALWIATEPAQVSSPLAGWLATQTEPQAALWLALRVLGFALIVPIAEELAFRGYLHRALAARRFDAAAPAAFTWLAFIATSVLFGAMHGRWLAGMLAGAAFALCLYRSKSLTGPIAAHVAANATIAAYAIATGAWGLL